MTNVTFHSSSKKKGTVVGYVPISLLPSEERKNGGKSKIVLLDKFNEQSKLVAPGDTWRVSLRDLDTFFIATPIEKIQDE